MTDIIALTPADPTMFGEPPVSDTMPDHDDSDGMRCDLCDRTFKNARGLSRHKTMTHGVAKDPESLSVPRRIQRDVSGKGAPTVDQLTKASGRLLGYGSIAVASIVVDDDPRRGQMSDEQYDQLVDMLAVQPDEAQDIMRPLARIFAGTTINKRVGRKIVDNMDAADSVMALIMLSRRWSQYMSDRNRYARDNQPVQVVQPRPAPVSNGNIPVMERGGVVMTPDMVAEMRRNN